MLGLLWDLVPGWLRVALVCCLIGYGIGFVIDCMIAIFQHI